ncbi:hypothetical protein C0J52_14872 [Blattella germanica]|nr:hypothetical protein C0J52_14872 [Blattella germanica]
MIGTVLTYCVHSSCRPNPFICGIRMHSVDFELESSMETPFGGACSDYFQAPGCGFLCGSINFSCEFSNY